MIEQFFITMMYCTELVLSGLKFFLICMITSREPSREYPADQGSDRVKAYHVLVEQQGSYFVDLRNLDSANLVGAT